MKHSCESTWIYNKEYILYGNWNRIARKNIASPNFLPKGEIDLWQNITLKGTIAKGRLFRPNKMSDN